MKKLITLALVLMTISLSAQAGCYNRLQTSRGLRFSSIPQRAFLGVMTLGLSSVLTYHYLVAPTKGTRRTSKILNDVLISHDRHKIDRGFSLVHEPSNTTKRFVRRVSRKVGRDVSYDEVATILEEADYRKFICPDREGVRHHYNYQELKNYVVNQL